MRVEVSPVPSVVERPPRWWPRLPGLSGPVLGLALLLAFFVVALSWNGQLANFLTGKNLRGLLHDSSVTAVVALGMLLVVISRGIDLSVGFVVGLVTVVTMKVYRGVLTSAEAELAASAAAVAAGVGTGALCGLVNGVAITRLRLSPFIVTLGMMSIAQGVGVWLSDKVTLGFPGDRPGWVRELEVVRQDSWLPDPGVWSVAVLAVLVAVLLRFTVLGRYCYAIGSNEATARLCGIDTDGTKVALYTVAGVLTGWAGILAFAQSGSGDYKIARGLELDVIAAVVIGGASLAGGQGTVLGTLVGVLILGVLGNGLNYCNVPVDVKYVLLGTIVIGNTALSGWRRAVV